MNCRSLFYFEKNTKKSSAAVVIIALRVDVFDSP